MNNPESLLTIKSVNFIRDGRRIIQNINFSVLRGECIVFTGANGTGKTTTLNILAGLLKPTSGEVFIQGISIYAFPQLAKKHIGFLADKPPLYHDLTIQEYFSLIAKLRAVSKSTRQTIIDSTLAKLNLTQYRNYLIGTLSKGLQQRVGIAQAILHQPALLLLDEPTQGLDPDQTDSFIHLLNEYKQHAAIILSSHNFPEVESICDRHLHFSNQEIKDYDLQHCPA